MNFILKFVVFSILITTIRADCDVCQANHIACHSRNRYSLCNNDIPTGDYITCPDNFICTADTFVCYDPENATPSCPHEDYTSLPIEENNCGVCDVYKVFACLNETTIAFCFGNDTPNEASVNYCLGDTVCDINNMLFCSDSSLAKPSCTTDTGFPEDDDLPPSTTLATTGPTTTESTTTDSTTTEVTTTEPTSTDPTESTTTEPTTTESTTTESTTTDPTTNESTTTEPTTITESTTTESPTTETKTTESTTTEPTTTETTTETTTTESTTTEFTTTESTTETPTTETTTTESTTTESPTTEPTTTESPTEPTTTESTTTGPTTTETTTTESTTTESTTTESTTTETTTTEYTTTESTTEPTTTESTTMPTTESTTPAAPRTPDQICQAAGSKGPHKPDDDDTCTKFINCYELNGEWKGALSNCPAGQYVQPDTGLCINNKPFGCSTEATTVTTTTAAPRTPDQLCNDGGVNGFYKPDDDDTCTKYINCYRDVNGVWRGLPRTCPFYFDPINKICVAEKPEGCP